MMEIIKCNCGYYKQLNDELCPKCGADYSRGDEYEVLEDQDTAYMRWQNLGGEKGFNEYMESISQPRYMLCPKCKFKMLITETNCPRCGIPVRLKKKDFWDYLEKFFEIYLKSYVGFAILAAVVFLIAFVIFVL